MLVRKILYGILQSLKKVSSHIKVSIKKYLPALVRADEWVDGRIFRTELKLFPSENVDSTELVIYSGWFGDQQKYVYIREPFDIKRAGIVGNESNIFTLLFSQQSYIRVGSLPEITSVTEPTNNPRNFGRCQVALVKVSSDEKVVEHLNFYFNRKGFEEPSYWWQIQKNELSSFSASM
jgi:hypothetical protein